MPSGLSCLTRRPKDIRAELLLDVAVAVAIFDRGMPGLPNDCPARAEFQRDGRLGARRSARCFGAILIAPSNRCGTLNLVQLT